MKHLICCLLPVVLVACSTRPKPRLAHPAGTNFTVPGVCTWLKDEEPTHVKLLFVHGMGGYKAASFRKLCERMEEQTKLEVTRCASHTLPVDGAKRPAALYQVTLERPGRPGGHRLDLFALDWGILNRAEKDRIRNRDSEFSNRDACLNLQAKAFFLHDAFVDVRLWLGDNRVAMSSAVEQSLIHLDQAARGESAEPGPTRQQSRIVIIASSLGSDMVVQTLRRMQTLEARSEVATRVVRDLDLIHLWANQILFLNQPAEVRRDGKEISSALSEWTELIRSRESLRRSEPKRDTLSAEPAQPWIVSISDPNDILSFPLPSDLLAQNPGVFVDIHLALTSTRFFPFFSRYSLANPLTAHTGHMESSCVMNILLHGSTVDQSGLWSSL